MLRLCTDSFALTYFFRIFFLAWNCIAFITFTPIAFTLIAFTLIAFILIAFIILAFTFFAFTFIALTHSIGSDSFNFSCSPFLHGFISTRFPIFINLYYERYCFGFSFQIDSYGMFVNSH